MLQVTGDGTIVESTLSTTSVSSFTNGWEPTNTYYQPVYWGSYPVYVHTDKTRKAIEILKVLQADKLVKCDSVPRFIELVERISNIL